jgi:hypothetical protein
MSTQWQPTHDVDNSQHHGSLLVQSHSGIYTIVTQYGSSVSAEKQYAMVKNGLPTYMYLYNYFDNKVKEIHDHGTCVELFYQ